MRGLAANRTEEPPPIGSQTLTLATVAAVRRNRGPRRYVQALAHNRHARFVRSQTIGRTSHSQCTSIEDVRIDHRCADIGMAKELLDCANVVPVFEQMRGKRMPERMATDALRDSSLSRSHCHGTLHRRLVQVISRWRSPPGVAAHPTRRKHKLPGPVRRGVRILPIERVRQHDGSDAVSQIPLVLPLHLGEMRCQWRLHRCR